MQKERYYQGSFTLSTDGCDWLDQTIDSFDEVNVVNLSYLIIMKSNSFIMAENFVKLMSLA